MALSTATFAALSLGDRKVLVGRHAVAQAGRDRHEVARPSELLRAEAFGHLAHELRDVSLLGCPDESSLGPERPQLGCRRSAALRVRLKASPRPNVIGSGTRSVGSGRYGCSQPGVLFPGAAVPPTWTRQEHRLRRRSCASIGAAASCAGVRCECRSSPLRQERGRGRRAPGRCSGLSPRIAHGQRLEEVPDAADGGLAQDDLK